MACIQFGFSASSETPSMVKFLSLYLLYAATTFGFSMRQGLHQLAQKSISTYLPLNWESETFFPEVSACENSSDCVPTAPTRSCAITVARFFANCVCKASPC